MRGLTLHPKSTHHRKNTDDPWKIELLIGNTGGTPAHIERSVVEIAWLKGDRDPIIPIKNEQIEACSLPAGGNERKEFLFPDLIPGNNGGIHVCLGISEIEVMEKGAQQTTFIYCAGIIKYTDDIDIKRETRFQRTFDVKTRRFIPSTDPEFEYAD
ncbi:MAG: hypothetical protein ABSF23_07235 [Terracidiphilus sp.]